MMRIYMYKFACTCVTYIDLRSLHSFKGVNYVHPNFKMYIWIDICSYDRHTDVGAAPEYT